MINTNFQSYRINNQLLPSFCGRHIIVRETKSYFEKLKINKKIDEALTKEFYRVNQQNLPQFIRTISEKIENIANLLTTPFLDIKTTDILGVFDENGKILGGLIGNKNFSNFHITGLYLDKSIQKTKDGAKAIKLLTEKIKYLAQKRNFKIITCEAYTKALSTIRLYKKAGFKEDTAINNTYGGLTTKLFVKTDEIGNNININQ